MSLFSFGNKVAKNSQKNLEQVPIPTKHPLVQVFSYLKSLTPDSDITHQFWTNSLFLQKNFPTGENPSLAKLFTSWENYVVNQNNLNLENKITHESIRDYIRSNISISNFHPNFRLIFESPLKQEILIFETFLEPAVKAFLKNRKSEQLLEIIKKQNKSPFFEGLNVINGELDFSSTNKYIETYNPKLEILRNAFSSLYSIIYGAIQNAFEKHEADEISKKIYADISKNYDQDIATIYLRVVPESSLGFDEWLSMLSKKELEAHVKQKTKELQELNDTLEEKVKQRTAELQKAYDELKELDRRKSEFISVVAHQLRTPLNGLKWTLDMFLKGDMGEMNEDQKQFLKQSYETNDYMISVVNEMLNTDRITSGKDTYTFGAVNIYDVIEAVKPNILPNVTKKMIKLSLPEINTQTPLIEADPEKMKFVIQNLLDNAIKYTPDGGSVDFEIDHSSDVLAFGISDTGIGIPEDQKNHIFERFYRAENAIRTVANGSGLGLFIVKEVVEKHHGKIWFENREGGGTTFFVELPIKQPLQKSSN